MRFPLTVLRAFAIAVCLALVFCLPAQPVLGQRGGDDDRRGERDRDDDDRRRGRDDDDDDDRDRRSREESAVDRQRREQERRKEFMQRLDRNGDGVIERSEVDSDRWWSHLQRRAGEAGLSVSDSIRVDKYLSARNTQERARLRADNPTAFLPGPEATMAPGFDVPLSEAELVMLNPNKERPYAPTPNSESKSSTKSGASRPSSGSSGESSGDRTERYAKSLMERYDKNGNSILERDEWKEMKGDPERSDLNKDGRITREELIKRFGSYRRDGDKDDKDRSFSGGKDRGEQRERGSRDDDEPRTTYRFTTALERVPKDAKSWIERYDKNDDGQVAMAEYSRTWTDSKVREFTKYDLDGDGIVTGDEYLDSKKR